MRLLITTDTVGGVWRFAQELVTGLLEAGDSVALVSFGRAASATQQAECARLTEQWGEAFSFLSTDVPLEWMQENEGVCARGAEVLARVARECGAEVLHANQFCYGAAELGIPAVVTAHSDVLSWGRACRGELEDSAWLRRYCEMVQRGLDAADAVTAPTVWMMRALGEGFRLPRERVVVANGRAVHVPRGVKRRLQAVMAGRLWDEAKDVAMLGGVRAAMPLIVAGEAECGGARASALPGVSLRGALSEEEMLRLFAESAVSMCTSRYEPFGLAPLEAALCGCAVVAREIDSLRQVWKDAAIYFRDAEELSRVLARMAEEPEFLSEAQRRAGARAREFSRARMVERYRAVYAGVLAKERACVA